MRGVWVEFCGNEEKCATLRMRHWNEKWDAPVRYSGGGAERLGGSG